MKRLVIIPTILFLLIGCSDKQISKFELIECYKVALQSIYNVDGDSFNKDLKYIVIKLDNLDIETDDKIKLINYMTDLSGVEVVEGDYSRIESNMINYNKFGGMAITLDKQKIISLNNIELVSRKFYLSGLEMKQTLEKKNGEWTISQISGIKKSK